MISIGKLKHNMDQHQALNSPTSNKNFCKKNKFIRKNSKQRNHHINNGNLCV